MSNSIDNELSEVLDERAKNYGRFADQARISLALRNIVCGGRSWSNMSPSMKESMIMILHKIARIVNGDPKYLDSWMDIAGYSELIIREVESD